MASQNVAPALLQNSHKGAECPSTGPVDGQSVSKRLQQDLMTLMMSGDSTVSAFPDGDNLFSWMAHIAVKFITPCYHPNVDSFGNICLDILKEKWSASYDVRTILLSIQSLLAEPNNNSPLNVEAADLWENQSDVVSSPDPTLPQRGGLVTSEGFLSCADTAVLKTEYKVVLLKKHKEATKS